MDRHAVCCLLIITWSLLITDLAGQREVLTAIYATKTFNTNIGVREVYIRADDSEADRAVRCTISTASTSLCNSGHDGGIMVYSGYNRTDGLLLGTFCGQSGQEDFFASANSMFVVINADVTLTLLYSTQNSCKMTVEATSEPRYLRTPGYPSAHSTGIGTSFYSCNWYIQSPPQHRLMLNLTIPSSSSRLDCADSVTLYDIIGDIANNKMRELGKYCGGDDSVFVTFSNLTRITMSFKIISYYGLQVALSVQPAPPCQHVIQLLPGSHGNITSLGYPNTLQDLQVCRWVLKVSTRSVVSVWFKDSHIQNTPGCQKDVARLYVEDDPEFNLLQWCSNHNKTYEFFVRSLVVELRTGFNHDRSYRGLHMLYRILTEPEIYQNKLIAYSDERRISSLNYPSHFPSYIKQVWHVTANNPNNVVKMHITRTDLGTSSTYCPYGYIHIYEGDQELESNLILRWCSRSIQLPQSYGPNVTIVFVANNNDKAALEGFVIQYREGQYGSNLEAGFYNETVTFPWSGNYRSGQDAFWNISTTISYHKIGLYFSHLDIKCPDDSISIYDVEGRLSSPVWSFCGQADRSYLSRHNKVYVRFRSATDQGRGFFLTYKDYLTPDGCDSMVYVHKVDASPRQMSVPRDQWQKQYFDMLKCQWRFHALGVSERIKLVIHVYNIVSQDSLSCTGDYIRVYNGYHTSNIRFPKICGVNLTKTIVSDNQYLYMEFTSDKLFAGAGFSVTFSSIKVSDPSVMVSSQTSLVGALIGGIAAVVFVIIIVIIFVIARKRKAQRSQNPPDYRVTFHGNRNEPDVAIQHISAPPDYIQSPPAYDDICGNRDKEVDLPPSYSEATQ